jgi:hypothetical protein
MVNHPNRDKKKARSFFARTPSGSTSGERKVAQSKLARLYDTLSNDGVHEVRAFNRLNLSVMDITEMVGLKPRTTDRFWVRHQWRLLLIKHGVTAKGTILI